MYDIERLKQIQRLKDELGVNLAGVDVILKLLDRIDELQEEVSRVREQSKRRLKRVTQDW
jgi:MerR family transcriptional regulator/heat shock protein HspR